MISYAQNFEDVMLNRVFRDRSTGFYIDVGAADPVNLSVTKAFYDRGWTGINVEPHPDFFKVLAEQRPRDINLNCGAGAADGEATLHEFADKGWSSFADETSEPVPGRPGPINHRIVPVITLDTIIVRHAGGRQIDFLKIDVEGWEKEVLEGIDLQRHRPTMILLEAVDRHTQELNSDWEDLLFAADYKLVYFDGLNKFYAGRENDGIEKHFAVPPNVFDDYRLNIAVEQEKQINALRWALRNTDDGRGSYREQIDRLTSQIKLFEADRASHLEQIRILAELGRELQRQLATSESDREARLDSINHLTEIFASTEAEQSRRLEQIQSLSHQLAEAPAFAPTAAESAAAHAESLATTVRSLERECAHLAASLEELKAKHRSELAPYRDTIRIGSLFVGWMKRT